jgi:hypothetical protein
MGDVYSVGATRYQAGRLVAPKNWGCRLAAYFDEYEAANLAAGSTLYMFLPCRGAKYAGFGQLAWDDLAAADKADLDAGAAAVTYLGYEFDGGTWVTITTAGNATDATGTIKLLMLMMMPT